LPAPLSEDGALFDQ